MFAHVNPSHIGRSALHLSNPLTDSLVVSLPGLLIYIFFETLLPQSLLYSFHLWLTLLAPLSRFHHQSFVIRFLPPGHFVASLVLFAAHGLSFVHLGLLSYTRPTISKRPYVMNHDFCPDLPKPLAPSCPPLPQLL
jgi:hypothetical protein